VLALENLLFGTDIKRRLLAVLPTKVMATDASLHLCDCVMNFSLEPPPFTMGPQAEREQFAADLWVQAIRVWSDGDFAGLALFVARADLHSRPGADSATKASSSDTFVPGSRRARAARGLGCGRAGPEALVEGGNDAVYQGLTHRPAAARSARH
jgi:hypothetical protein